MSDFLFVPTTAAYLTRAFYTDFSAIEQPLTAQSTRRITGETAGAQSAEPTLLDTETRLLLTRTEKLLPGLWQEWYTKQAYLTGIDAQDAFMRIRRLLLTVPLVATTLSAGFTYEQSIYVRAELPGLAGGTLYMEINLGDDADSAEDSFVSIRQNKQEKWSISGPFGQVLVKVRHHLSA